MSFPSELPFASFLKYAPWGESKTSLESDRVCRAVKNDGFLIRNSLPFFVIDEAAKRIAARLSDFPFLELLFGPDVTLVPIPRRNPLSDKNALWPGLRICQELLKQGLGREISPILERVTPVQKAATATKGKRPTPPDHFKSTEVLIKDSLFAPKKITLIDDVITQGSTFVGMYPKVQAAFPKAQINCFALVRTISPGEVETILDPVKGIITYVQGQLHREP